MSVVDTEASYEELAADAPKDVPEAEEAPVKKKRGRPPGSKNKPKTPPSPPEPESVTPEPAEPASPAESASPAAPKEPQSAARAGSAVVPALDVEFDEGPGGAGPPARPRTSAKTPRARKPAQPVGLARSQSAVDYDLLHYVAEAARAYGAQERRKRQDFYNRYLPIG